MRAVDEILREEIRALEIERALLGYVMACCAEQVPDSEMRALLFARVHKMTAPALRKTEDRCEVILRNGGADFLDVIAEEVHRIAELCITQDMSMMSAGAAFAEIGTGNVN